MHHLRTTITTHATHTRRPLGGLVALLALTGVGCAAETGASEAPLPSISMAQLISEGEISPLCGQQFEGSLKAEVPLRGLSRTADDVITAYVFDHAAGPDGEWVELGRAQSDPIPMANVDGEPVYPFDFGMACVMDCEQTLPLYAWHGVGPFQASFKLHSAAHGWLPAVAGVEAEASNMAGCTGSRDAAEIRVLANRPR